VFNLTKNQVKMFVDSPQFKEMHPHQWRYLQTQNMKYEIGVKEQQELTRIEFCGETGMAQETMEKMLRNVNKENENNN